jgi:alpha-tubulin suppressor-like RCC1 family protein
MIRSGILNSRAGRARRAGPTAARALAGATMAALAGLAVSLAAGPVPAFAAQHRGGPAASHSRAVGTGQPMATGRVGPGVSWAHVAVGSYHTCGIRTDATLWCWGFNDYGQLGLGNHANQDRPQQVTTPAAGGWTSVTAGIYYTCATRTDGTVWCWGYNGQGQVGIGNESGQDLPRQVTTPARGGWTSVTASGDATCATRTGGTLWCWGYNFYGQLGLGNHTNQDRPQQVVTPAAGGWTSVSAGGEHTCATRTSGTLWCWGYNDVGQLGVGSHAAQDLPRQVATPATGGWTSVTASYGHTCATRTGGTLWCWGWGWYGQLGLGSHTNQDRPQQVTTPAAGGWTGMTALGYAHTCATRTGGTLWCWGYNVAGQLGLGGDTDQDLPRQVTTPAAGGWAAVSATFEHTCATRADGTLWCWGKNDFGELGIGGDTDQDLPRQVTG